MRLLAIDVLSGVLAILILAMVGLVVMKVCNVPAILVAGQQKGDIDKAQAHFEVGDDRARMYNWPVFKQANSVAKLDCVEIKELRSCTITSQGFDPMTGEPAGKIRESFACTRWSCTWAP